MPREIFNPTRCLTCRLYFRVQKSHTSKKFSGKKFPKILGLLRKKIVFGTRATGGVAAFTEQGINEHGDRSSAFSRFGPCPGEKKSGRQCVEGTGMRESKNNFLKDLPQLGMRAQGVEP
jgi:hypothetical protein